MPIADFVVPRSAANMAELVALGAPGWHVGTVEFLNQIRYMMDAIFRFSVSSGWQQSPGLPRRRVERTHTRVQGGNSISRFSLSLSLAQLWC